MLDIAIIGAGIGGPAAAIGLARQGHKVTIYERSDSTSNVGYAFRITPNSDLCLRNLGIDSVAAGAVEANTMRSHDAKGNLIRETIEKHGSDFSHIGRSVFASRSQLHRQLTVAAQANGVTLITGKKVVSIDVVDTVFKLEDGEKISADVIIGADGIHSAVRDCVVEGPRPQLEQSGVSCFRFTVPISRAKEDPLLGPILKNDDHMLSWAGNRKMIIVYPVDRNTVWNVNCLHPSDLSSQELSEGELNKAIDYDQGVSYDTVMSIYDDFNPTAKSLITLANRDGFRAWPLADMGEIHNWSKNNTVLLGDACHPVLPSGYSGASMAIEDAITLATVLTPEVDKSALQDRLRLYESIRRPRVQRVRVTARENKFGSGDPARQVGYREFLFSHNAITHAQKELEKHLREI